MLTSLLLLTSSLLTASPSTLAIPLASKDPPIHLWFNQGGDYAYGDRAKVYAKSAADGYLVVLQADGNGRVRVLFPLDPGGDQHIAGGKKYEIKGRGGREAFVADNTKVHGTVLAAVSGSPFRFEGLVQNGRWDTQALVDPRLRDDPESGLLNLVQRMKPSNEHFDFDVGTYVVSQQYVRDRDGYPYYWGYQPWWGYGRSYGFGLWERPLFWSRGFRHS
jgi:hypothetical protein